MLHIVKLDTVGGRTDSPDYEVLYAELLQRGGFEGKIEHYDAREGEFPSAAIGDTVLLGGSRLDAFACDPFTLDLVRRTQEWLRTDGIRLLGVCYGHQIVARALGARVERTGWELGASALTFTPEGLAIFPELESGDGLQQVHQDEVLALPAGATLLASSKQCAIQVFHRPNKYLCIQGHPEFSTEVTTALIEKLHTKAPGQYEQGLKQARLPHKGPFFGSAMARLASFDA